MYEERGLFSIRPTSANEAGSPVVVVTCSGAPPINSLDLWRLGEWSLEASMKGNPVRCRRVTRNKPAKFMVAVQNQ